MSKRTLGIVAVLMLLVLVGLGLWGRLTMSRRQAEWQARTDSLLTTQREEWVAVTGRLQTALGAERARGDSLRVLTVRLVDQYARSAAATRALLGRIPTGLALDTLPAEACRAILGQVVSSCEWSLVQADSALQASRAETASAERRFTLADSLAGHHLRRALTLEGQLRTAPVGSRKLFGFLPYPTVVIGAGCAAGMRAGCGGAVVLGFPIF